MKRTRQTVQVDRLLPCNTPPPVVPEADSGPLPTYRLPRMDWKFPTGIASPSVGWKRTASPGGTLSPKPSLLQVRRDMCVHDGVQPHWSRISWDKGFWMEPLIRSTIPFRICIHCIVYFTVLTLSLYNICVVCCCTLCGHLHTVLSYCCLFCRHDNSCVVGGDSCSGRKPSSCHPLMSSSLAIVRSMLTCHIFATIPLLLTDDAFEPVGESSCYCLLCRT